MRLLKNPQLCERLKKIKLLILDVDGVMTTGDVFWLDGHGWTRNFNVKDGYGIRLLMTAGVEVAIISGGDSADVRKRAEWLKIEHAYFGDTDKIKALEKIQNDTQLEYEQMAFVGDDLYDIPVLERVGFSATVPHAVSPVQERVHYVTEAEGGRGAVREITDAIRTVQGLGPEKYQ